MRGKLLTGFLLVVAVEPVYGKLVREIFFSFLKMACEDLAEI